MGSIGYSNSSLGFIIFDILTIASNQLQRLNRTLTRELSVHQTIRLYDMLGEQDMELKGKIIGQSVGF
ncbi:MAG TPA: hypothetical protein VF884_14085 [Nitrososphaeraceae archaeon]